MKRIIAIGVLGLSVALSMPENLGGMSATCTGADPCKACKNCKYCAHCNAGKGKCGVCK